MFTLISSCSIIGFHRTQSRKSKATSKELFLKLDTHPQAGEDFIGLTRFPAVVKFVLILPASL